ncbi:hypothetical protein YC2023_094061 [Brassica napus]
MHHSARNRSVRALNNFFRTLRKQELEAKAEAWNGKGNIDMESGSNNKPGSSKLVFARACKKLIFIHKPIKYLSRSPDTATDHRILVPSFIIRTEPNLKLFDAPQHMDQYMEPDQNGVQAVQSSSNKVRPSDRTDQTDRSVYRIDPRTSRMELRLEPRPDD